MAVTALLHEYNGHNSGEHTEIILRWGRLSLGCSERLSRLGPKDDIRE